MIGDGKILVVDDVPKTCASSKPSSRRTATTCLSSSHRSARNSRIFGLAASLPVNTRRCP
jgi:hypothetical protein